MRQVAELLRLPVAVGLLLLSAGASVAASTAVASAAEAPAARDGLKDELHGLTSQGVPRPGLPIANEVVRVSWEAAEPRQGSFDLAEVDARIERARAAGRGVKLRIMAGVQAPGWVKNLGGAPFSYRHGDGDIAGTVGRWWSPEHGAAYGAFNAYLADRYDDNPTVREVTLSRCMTEFAEPLWREFVRQPLNAAAARAAGYSDTADRLCQRHQIVTDGAPWRRTHLTLALTGAAYLDGSGRPYIDNTAPFDNLDLLLDTWGAKGLPENNQLAGGRDSSRLYEEIKRRAVPATYQVETYSKLDPAGVPGMLAALRTGCVTMKAHSVELPSGYHAATAAQLQVYANACTANRLGSSGAPAMALGQDYDRDGRSDPAVFRPSNGTWYLGGAAANAGYGQAGDVAVPADYNADGRSDPAVFRPAAGTWHLGGAAANREYGRAGDIPLPADYNGDGRSDPAVFRPADGTWYLGGVAANRTYGQRGDIPAPADYNGDGRADTAVFRPASGTWYLGGAAANETYGQRGDIPVAADYNGDGRADVAVFRPSTGTWHFGGAAANRAYGQLGDIPAPADYNGNGRADPAVFRPSAGTWHLGGAAPNRTYGQAGDVPVTAHARSGVLR